MRRLTQREVAAMANLYPSDVCRAELAKLPLPGHVERIGNAFGLTEYEGMQEVTLEVHSTMTRKTEEET
jgi:hypothetical protein